MDKTFGSFKTLEKVRLKATYNMKIDNIEFEEGETIAFFDTIDISNFKEIKDSIAATGGFDNRGLVYWTTTNEILLEFSRGVFSKDQFGLLTNSKIISIEQNKPILLTATEKLETNLDGYIKTKYYPRDQIFVYKEDTGEKLQWNLIGDRLKTDFAYTNVVVTYCYYYTNGASVAKIGQQFLKGYLELEGQTRVKDDTSGLITTGIIKIPKLKLMSGISMKLGTQANPVVGNFQAVGVPVEERHNSYVAEFYFLNNDIDSDM